MKLYKFTRNLKYHHWVLLFIITSCGVNSSNDDSSFQSKLIGTWKTDCSNDNSKESTRTTWKFSSDDSFVVTEIKYNGLNCSDEKIQWVNQGQGTFALIENANAANGEKSIEFVYDAFDVIPKSQELVDYLNDAEYCEISDWEVDGEVNLFNKSCTSSFGVDKFPSANTKYYDLVDVIDNKMWLGKKVNSFLDVSRPSKLNDDKVYKKS